MKRKLLIGGGIVAAVMLIELAFGMDGAVPPYVPGQRRPVPVPADLRHDDARLETSDGVRLLHQTWRPLGEPKAALLIVHGLKDYGDRYIEFAQAAARRGYAVHLIDLRGHGDSEGPRVWVERFDLYLDDLARAVAQVQREEPGKPLFLFGHSMGGAIVTLFTLEQKPKLAGLVTSAGALKRDAPGALVAAVKFFSSVAPKLAVFELDDSKFSRDPNVVASMKTDPLIFDGKGPARTAAELLGAIERIEAGSAQLEVPLLSLHGTKDEVTPPAGSAALVAAAKSTDKTLRTFDGLAHDLLHEPERADVSEAILSWLDARVPQAAPAPGP